ncbi:DNA ligase [Serinicoccus chungangensis]|uniref:DNA ligase (ATP) n=1 Tax=Serinicoccus chungangensis TaxID=767452 RepID=A0A0W8I2A6_9MICO|nr:non-homologous end-joining DNA ligase [Serinicoccus chungangensis]KUG51797.1 DNA ligase [Serinicoccus chungangensis]
MRPMLATPGEVPARPPTGPAWVHEIKWDGIRLLADVTEGRLRLLTRGGRDIAHAFPELAALGAVAEDLLLDGEAVCLVEGRPSFSHVVERVHVGRGAAAERLAAARPATYVVFDLLRLDGLDLTALPWSSRREALEQLVEDVPGVQLSPVYDDGAMLLTATREQHLEGVVSKRRDAAYHPGTRSTAWVKFPHRDRVSVVVGGWRPETDRPGRIGAVHVGLPLRGPDGMPQLAADGSLRLRYRGRVGSGLAGRAGEQLQRLLAGVPAGDYPFDAPIPPVEARGSTWLRPQVVVDVAALGADGTVGRLRQPSFQGVRPDLAPADLVAPVEEPR